MKKWIVLSCLLVVLAACEKEKRTCTAQEERNYSSTGFSKISAGETFRIKVTKGEQFQVKATGCSSDLDDLRVVNGTGGILSFEYDRFVNDRQPVDITVVLPHLVSIQLNGAARAEISGFGGQQSVIRNVLTGVSECNMTGTGINAQVDLSGTSVLHLSGDTESLYGSISGAARLHGYDVKATEVDISTSGTARAYVQPTQMIFAEASGESRVYYRGNPPTTHFSTSGNGKVINE